MPSIFRGDKTSKSPSSKNKIQENLKLSSKNKKVLEKEKESPILPVFAKVDHSNLMFSNEEKESEKLINLDKRKEFFRQVSNIPVATASFDSSIILSKSLFPSSPSSPSRKISKDDSRLELKPGFTHDQEIKATLVWIKKCNKAKKEKEALEIEVEQLRKNHGGYLEQKKIRELEKELREANKILEEKEKIKSEVEAENKLSPLENLQQEKELDKKIEELEKKDQFSMERIKKFEKSLEDKEEQIRKLEEKIVGKSDREEKSPEELVLIQKQQQALRIVDRANTYTFFVSIGLLVIGGLLKVPAIEKIMKWMPNVIPNIVLGIGGGSLAVSVMQKGISNGYTEALDNIKNRKEELTI